jgi:hypothetical protein
MVMKLRTALIAGLLVLLTACISYPRTHLLVTPIGVAGVHSFAPKGRSPDADVALKELKARTNEPKRPETTLAADTAR